MKKIGAIARPDDILLTADLPKTRSGKIMRRLLRDIAEGKTLGDTTTLADPAAVARLKADYEDGDRAPVARRSRWIGRSGDRSDAMSIAAVCRREPRADGRLD